MKAGFLLSEKRVKNKEREKEMNRLCGVGLKLEISIRTVFSIYAEIQK